MEEFGNKLIAINVVGVEGDLDRSRLLKIEQANESSIYIKSELIMAATKYVHGKQLLIQEWKQSNEKMVIN